MYPRLRYFLEILFTASVYFILAKFSLLLQFESSNATPIWPPSGFAFAMILLLGYRVAPGVLLGAFAANLTAFISNQTSEFPGSVLMSSIIAVGNTGEALAGYYLMNRLIPESGTNNFFLTVRHIFRFFLVALIISLVSCTTGSIAVFLGSIVTLNQIPIVWLTWWLGDVSGIILVSSFILIWVHSLKVRPLINFQGKRRFETIALILLTIVVSGVIFDDWLAPHFTFRLAFWIIPLMVWAGLRYEQRETITVVVISAMLLLWGTVHGHGPLAAGSLNYSLLTAQAFVSLSCTSVLVFNASIIVQRKTEAMLRNAVSQLEAGVKERTTKLEDTASELTEKKEEIEQQRDFVETLFDSVEDLMAVFDTQGNFLAVNKKIEETYKVKKEDILGVNFLKAFPAAVGTAMYRNLLKAIQGERVHDISYFSMITKRYYENFFIPLKDHHSRVYGVLVIGHDITHVIESSEKVKDANLLLEKQNYDLERMNQELASFSYVASHDLQEPLRKIQMFTKLITDKEAAVLSEKGKDYFARIENASKRMQQLILDLLAYSRTNTAERHFEKTDIGLLLEQVKKEMNEKISETNTVIEISPLPQIKVIPYQFQQLFTNLISNSIKFSKAGITPKIHIASALLDGIPVKEANGNAEKRYYHLSITDNGIGFESQYQERIFGLFQRLHGRNEYEGTGIGLSICKRVIENHRGYIDAQSEPGKGTTFNIYIPAD